MSPRTFGLAFLTCAALAAPSRSQGIGSRMPVAELEGYANTPAKSFEEFTGRAVLIEFFAYW